METKTKHRVICFGEVLWDILPSGAVPGGAPMNVAYHLHKLGKNPALIARIGSDEKGQQLVEIFKAHGVCTDFFQIDDEHQTGKVFAEPNEINEVVYDIVKPVAWDFIAWHDEYAGLVADADYFVFGSLAARSHESKQTLLKLLEAAKIKVLDINLRSPHYDQRIVEELLRKTDFLKLNLSELELICNWYSNNISNRRIADQVAIIADKFHIRNIVVTMGGDGAFMYLDGNTYTHRGISVKVNDTVGSGDAFLAGLLSRVMEGDDPSQALNFANAMGAFIATQTGACPDYELADVDRLGKM
jgi:fructokinase